MPSQPSTQQRSGNGNAGADSGFLSSIMEIRQRARQSMEEGAVTPSYSLDKEKVIELLNEALATELVCVLRYRRHYFMAEGIHSEAIKKEFLTHATEELQHADKIAERIVQLGGEPDFAPNVIGGRSHSEYKEGGDLRDMLRENLVAERIAIESYREMVNFIGDHDSTTRRMLEEILAVEEHHADDMASLMKRVG